MIKIDQLIKEALLAKDKVALNVYKNLKSELQKVLTAKNAPEYSETLFVQVTAKYAKSLEDAVLQFSEAHREDLVAEYSDELEVLRKLLPEPVSESDLYVFIGKDKEYFSQFTEEYLDENGKVTRGIQIPKKEMGNAIKHLKSKFPQADGKLISTIVKEYCI